MITNYSRSPLLVTAWIGFLSALCAVILGSFYVVMTLLGGRVVPGWASVIVSVSFFSAIQLFILGMMGEYVARLQTNSNSKPKFLIREIVNGSESEE
jgi:dolichol-phosphate mannosyltransferase